MNHNLTQIVTKGEWLGSAEVWTARFTYHDADAELVGSDDHEDGAVIDLMTRALTDNAGSDGSEEETIVDLAMIGWAASQ